MKEKDWILPASFLKEKEKERNISKEMRYIRVMIADSTYFGRQTCVFVDLTKTAIDELKEKGYSVTTIESNENPWHDFYEVEW